MGLLFDLVMSQINLKLLALAAVAAVIFASPLVQSAHILSLEDISQEIDRFFEIDNTQDNRIKKVNENGDNVVIIKEKSEVKTVDQPLFIQKAYAQAGDLKIIASVDVSNSDWCGLDFDVYINDNGIKRNGNAQSCGDSITFNVPLVVGESVDICANGHCIN
jgi:hypothetical protein